MTDPRAIACVITANTISLIVSSVSILTIETSPPPTDTVYTHFAMPLARRAIKYQSNGGIAKLIVKTATSTSVISVAQLTRPPMSPKICSR